MDFVFGSAQAVLRLGVSAFLWCRRQRLFRDPDGVHTETQGDFRVLVHRRGNQERCVIPIRSGDPFEHHGKVPWGWIGVHENRGDYTEDLANQMVPGNVLTPAFLWARFPETRGEVIKYLSIDTQEIIELPSEGITIDALTHA